MSNSCCSIELSVDIFKHRRILTQDDKYNSEPSAYYLVVIDLRVKPIHHHTTMKCLCICIAFQICLADHLLDLISIVTEWYLKDTGTE